jgi:hypothetical protein
MKCADQANVSLLSSSYELSVKVANTNGNENEARELRREIRRIKGTKVLDEDSRP